VDVEQLGVEYPLLLLDPLMQWTANLRRMHDDWRRGGTVTMEEASEEVEEEEQVENDDPEGHLVLCQVSEGGDGPS
jgi:hypothetical protein